MLPTLIRAAAVLLCASLGAVWAPLRAQTAASQAPALPEGQGKSLVTARCVGCHTLDVALSRRGTADEWRATVRTMIELGAPITSADAEAMARYLGEHFGPTAAPSAAAQAPPSAASALPDGAGKDVLMRKCFQCHQMSMWSALRQDRKEWESVLYRMVGRGALWTEDEITAMADYLARVAGPAPAAPR